jgi:hypothetical protein
VSGGGVFLDGEWLRVGSTVAILRDGWHGRIGIFKGKRKDGKLDVNVSGTAVKLHLAASEIRRAIPVSGS